VVLVELDGHFVVLLVGGDAVELAHELGLILERALVGWLFSPTDHLVVAEALQGVDDLFLVVPGKVEGHLREGDLAEGALVGAAVDAIEGLVGIGAGPHADGFLAGLDGFASALDIALVLRLDLLNPLLDFLFLLAEVGRRLLDLALALSGLAFEIGGLFEEVVHVAAIGDAFPEDVRVVSEFWHIRLGGGCCGVVMVSGRCGADPVP